MLESNFGRDFILPMNARSKPQKSPHQARAFANLVDKTLTGSNLARLEP
mgnify:CR=1